MAELRIDPKDITLVQALKPYTHTKVQAFIDMMTDILDRLNREGVPLTTEFMAQQIQQITVNAYSLFLILILLLLSQPSNSDPGQGSSWLPRSRR